MEWALSFLVIFHVSISSHYRVFIFLWGVESKPVGTLFLKVLSALSGLPFWQERDKSRVWKSKGKQKPGRCTLPTRVKRLVDQRLFRRTKKKETALNKKQTVSLPHCRREFGNAKCRARTGVSVCFWECIQCTFAHLLIFLDRIFIFCYMFSGA